MTALKLRPVATDARGVARLRALQFVAVLGTALSPASTSRAATVPAEPSPIAFTEASACPTIAQATGSEGQAGAIRSMRTLAGRGEDGEFLRTLIGYLAVSYPIAAVSICDPDAAAARRPLGAFGGARLGDPGTDAIAPGMRALTATPGTDDAALHAGDRIELPAAGPGAVIDVRIDGGAAVASLRIPPSDPAPRTLEVVGTKAAPVVRLTLADGSTVDHVAVAPAVTAPSLTVRARGRRLVLGGIVQPGSLLIADHPHAEDEFLPAPDGSTGADAQGRFSLRTAALPRGMRTVTLDAVDVPSGVASSWSCALSWRGARITKTRCRPRPVKPATTRGNLPVPSFAAVPQRDEHEVAPARRLAQAATAPATAPARTERVTQLSYEVIPEASGGLSAADLNGDGRPEIFSGGSIGEQVLFISDARGWRRAKLLASESEFASFALTGDITGDGLGELWTSKGRGINGSRAWATGPTPTIDLAPSAALGAADLELTSSGDGYEPESPDPLPDGTGDGRPELLVGEAIFASESVPLGRATGLPQGWAPLTTQFFDELTSLLGTITSEKGDGVVAADEATFSSAKAPLRSVTSLATRTGKKVSSATTLASLGAAGDWAATTTGTVTLPGAARALDADPATGEVLLAATDCKGRRCLTRFVRVDPSGRVLATATYRGDDDEPAGYFVADGNDADVLPEVVLRPRGEEWTSRLPLWRSTAGNAKVSALPELAARGKPIVAEGPSVAWKRDGAPAGLVVIGAANRRSGNAPLMVVTPE